MPLSSRLVRKKLFPFLESFRTGPGQPTDSAAQPATDMITTLQPPAHVCRPEDFLDIPVPEHSVDDQACRDARSRGQFLARQDMWDDLSREIRDADLERRTTPGGMPVAELLAFGARSDVVHAVEHALLEGVSEDSATLVEGITGLENMRQDMREDPYINMIVSMAHVDIAWAWRGSAWATMVPRVNRERFAAHFDRAHSLMDPFCFLEMDSPVMASATCSLLTGRQDRGRRIADIYEDLIDLDPQNHRHMRALGNHMLPRWFGSHTELELEARRTAARTQDIWGAGGYTWVQFDAIAIDEQACANVDVPFFVDGLHDIIAARPTQEMANLLAAYCSVAICNGLDLCESADLSRLQIADAAEWLIRDHLHEIHPLIWAHAAEGFDNSARVTSPKRFAARGRADALQIVANMFREEISQGQRVIFTPDGKEMRPI